MTEEAKSATRFAILCIYFSAMVCGAWLGAMGTFVFDRWDNDANLDNVPLKLSAAQLSGVDVPITMPPLEATIELLPKDDFDRLWVAADQATPAAAYTSWEGGKCVIRMPVYDVVATPKLARANFSDPFNAQVFAHEMLHCATGLWHPDPQALVAILHLPARQPGANEYSKVSQ